MKITELNFKGVFKSKATSGKVNNYKKGDVVYYDNETYVAFRSVAGETPLRGEDSGWHCMSKTQVFFETKSVPVIAKAGDEWFDISKGIKYKRVNDVNGDHWIEI
jgi:hypothetical protein